MNTTMMIEDFIFDGEFTKGVFSVTHSSKGSEIVSIIKNSYGEKVSVINNENSVFVEFNNGTTYSVENESELLDVLGEYLNDNMLQ